MQIELDYNHRLNTLNRYDNRPKMYVKRCRWIFINFIATSMPVHHILYFMYMTTLEEYIEERCTATTITSLSVESELILK